MKYTYHIKMIRETGQAWLGETRKRAALSVEVVVPRALFSDGRGWVVY